MDVIVWPAAVVLIAIALLVIERKPIAELIGRVNSIGKDGVRTAPPQQTRESVVDARAEADKLMRGLDSTLLLDVENEINDELKRRNLFGGEAIPVLVRYLAAARITLGFAEVDRLIWGSQLNLLNYLNAHPGQPKDSIRPFYVSAADRYPKTYSEYPIEAWLGFLKNCLLVREDAGLLNITVKGREFLGFMVRTGLPMDRPL